jgi:hypothetical protein
LLKALSTIFRGSIGDESSIPNAVWANKIVESRQRPSRSFIY